MVDEFLHTENSSLVSKYWWYLAQQILLQLQMDGYDHFKQTISRHYFCQVNKIRDCEETYTRLLYAYVKEHGGIMFDEPQDGHPSGCMIDGRFIGQDMLHTALEAMELQKQIPLSNHSSILEIGGGYGRLAWYLNQLYPGLRYVIVDIPPALYLSRRYLRHHAHTVSTLMPHELATLQERFDVVVAFDCLREMSREQVSWYFTQIDRLANHCYATSSETVTIPFADDQVTPPTWPIPARWILQGTTIPLIPKNYRNYFWAIQ